MHVCAICWKVGKRGYVLHSLSQRVKKGGWCTREVKEGFGSVWKAIRKEWGLVSSRISFVVGNGQRVKFWIDK